MSVDAACGCPHAEGPSGTGGCIFCNVASFSPSRQFRGLSIKEQIDRGVKRLGARYGASRFLAYFQPGTNTHGSPGQLRKLWDEAFTSPNIVGLAVGTRPDCVPGAVLDHLGELARHEYVSLELGLQTIHAQSLAWLNRGHSHDAFRDAVGRAREHSRSLRIGAHLILGLPGENVEQMLATARELNRLGIDSVKLHNLCVVKQTRLAEWFAAGGVELPSREEYVGYVVDFLEELGPSCVVDRLSCDISPEYLIAPSWCLDKSAVREAILREFERRNTWQGRRCPADLPRKRPP